METLTQRGPNSWRSFLWTAAGIQLFEAREQKASERARELKASTTLSADIVPSYGTRFFLDPSIKVRM